MKVFLSWSGETSKAAAIALHGWLPTVIQTVRPYMSAESIDKGERWSVDIAKQLEETHFGIICVTPDNREAPWILFEAGALSKSMDRGRVSPLAFGVLASDFTNSPLLQFQFTLFKKDDFKKLLLSINDAAPDTEKLNADVLTRSFERGWSELEDEINKISFDNAKSSTKAARTLSPTNLESTLDELLTIARSQMKLLRSPEELLPSKYLRRFLRTDPTSELPNSSHPVWRDLDEATSLAQKIVKEQRHLGVISLGSEDQIQLADILRRVTDYIFMTIKYKPFEEGRLSARSTSDAESLLRLRRNRIADVRSDDDS